MTGAWPKPPPRESAPARRRLAPWLFLALFLALLAAGGLIWRRGQAPTVGAALLPGSSATAAQGFERARPGGVILLPADHGAHPAFQTEWWYFTGNLSDSEGHHWGYQFTIFRRALQANAPPRASAWGGAQVYSAHLALTDVTRDAHEGWERFSRAGAGLAGAQGQPFRVWLEDWQVAEQAPGIWRLRAANADYALDLTLQPAKPVVRHGEDGYSRKGAEPGNASYYYSFTRLQTIGVIAAHGRQASVDGLSWMDHEWSTSALGADQVGWDWFSVQLDDGWEVMIFQLRRQDGSIDPVSSGTLIDPGGAALPLAAADFVITPSGAWRSPGGVRYPNRWQVRIPTYKLELQLTPLVADQEMRLSTRYWEGAVNASGRHMDKMVAGYGYVELTGYGESMEGRF